MKLALISDTHGMLPDPELFDGVDAILHAGDVGPDYNVREWISSTFIPWQDALPCPLYATLGNHDFPDKWNIEIPNIYLDEERKIGDLNVWFSPWSPTFGSWAWMRSEPALTEICQQIPDDTHIIVSHSPPYQLCDMNAQGEHCGSKALRVRMQKLPDLKFIICGHIHEGRGEKALGGVRVINASCVDEHYSMWDNPITWLEV